jgi:folate-binding protein YgfZ
MSVLHLVELGDRGRLELTGTDRVRFLQGMVTADVAALAPGQGARAAMLTPKGRVVADMLVLAESDRFLITTEPALRVSLRETLERYIVMDDAALADVTDATRELGVYGADARARVMPLAARLRACEAPLGVHLMGPPSEVSAARARLIAGGARELDAAAAEVLRVEHGITKYGAEISTDVLPLEAGLDQAISHTKGCYIGQEPVARVTTRGHVNKRIVGLRCARLPHPGDRVAGPDRPDAGTVTSVAESPRAGALALAFLHRSLWEPGTTVTVGQGITAEVAALPMVSW